MKNVLLSRIGMRVAKTAVAVMLSYTVFVPFGLIYNEALGGVWGQLGPPYACTACITCTQSTLSQTTQQSLSRLIGVAVGGALGIATLPLGAALDDPWVRTPALEVVCVAGVWIYPLPKRPTACSMACILSHVILITGVTGVTRYYYATACIIEMVVGLPIALGVNAALPDLRPEPKKEAPHMQVEVRNSMKKSCIVGESVLHSKSPLIQNTMLAALGLDHVYFCQPVLRRRCREWLECAKFAGYAGFNATMPHKEELAELMDELDGDVRLFGMVNTVCIRDGRIYGYNTDGVGFLRALSDEGTDPVGKRVLVLGAEGAARAVCLKLAQAGAGVVVCNRTADKAATLCAHELARLRPAGSDPDTLRRKAAECGLLVNCIFLGIEGAAGQFEESSFLDALPARAPVVDLIYTPAETELFRRTRGGGHQTANGFGLLVNQVVLSLEHFTSTAIDVAEMKRWLADVLLP